MIDLVTLSKEWITEKQKKHKRDPGIIESMVHALFLLEQLKHSGLDFIFKGGTSLILLLDKAARFSVDIDVVVSPELKQKSLEKYLDKIIANSSGVFSEVLLDERRSYKGPVPKAHYRFRYKSAFVGKEKEGQIKQNIDREILLDVLFAENPYPNLVQKPIYTEWIKLKGEPLVVTMPCLNSISGDKLVAFAPNTTGVPYWRSSKNKEGEDVLSEMFREIVKQLFDVGCLFDVIDDTAIFRESYRISVASEIQYRADRNIKSPEEVLRDTISTALILARRDKQVNVIDKQNFTNLSTGLDQFAHFVYGGNFKIEQAQLASAKAAYLAAIQLTGYAGSLVRFNEDLPLEEYLITHPEYHFLNKQLKFVHRGEALFYWSQTIKLLYPDSVLNK
jgi:hypothetical protein